MKVISIILLLLAVWEVPGVQECNLELPKTGAASKERRSSRHQRRRLQTRPLPRVGAVASSVENSSFGADEAIDGDMSSRWSSLRNDREWIYVDLGASYTVTRVTLRWEQAFGLDYDIEVSNNARDWIVKKTVLQGDGGTDTIDLPPGTAARYVRMQGLRRGSLWGYSLYDFSAEGHDSGVVLPESNPDLMATSNGLPRAGVQASSEVSKYVASNAIDGKMKTRWKSEKSDDEWIFVDMGDTYTVSRVVLHWQLAYGREYDIETSDDANKWNVKYSVTMGDGDTDVVELPEGTKARYVRMRGHRMGTSYGYSLFEFDLQGGTNIPTPAPQLTTPGDNYFPSDVFPLDRCQGDCDVDSECRPGLKCFHRNSLESVPGCSGEGSVAKDYCYDPVGSDSAPTPSLRDHFFRLYWQRGYKWQKSTSEFFICMVARENRIRIETCSNHTSTKWEFIFVDGFNNQEGDQIKVSGTDRCIGVSKNNNKTINLQRCKKKKSRQRWVPGVEGGFRDEKFDIRPVHDLTRCLTQPHHPTPGEKVYVEECERAHRHRTGYWSKY